MTPYPQAYTSMIQFTVDGRPSINDIHELFSTMISQLMLTTHRYILRSYTNTFTSEEAIKQLGSLKFSKIDNCSTFASFTTTTFNMARDMAKALLQQFLWTRLIENAVEPQNRSYRDKGIWRIKPKGLCVLQDFGLRTKTDLSRFKKNVEMNAELMYLINLERVQSNDRINRNRKYMACLFTIMIASFPLRGNNRDRQGDFQSYILPTQSKPEAESITIDALRDFGIQDVLEVSRTPSVHSADSSLVDTKSNPRNLGITDFFPNITILANDLLVDAESVNGTYYHQQSLINNLNPSYSNKFKMRSIFSSQLCCDWLVGYCTASSTDEAETVVTEFLKLGWITFFDKRNGHLEEVESSKSNILKLTKKGMNVIINVSLNQHSLIKSHTTSCQSSLVFSSNDHLTPHFDDRTMDSPLQTPLSANTIDYFSMGTPSRVLPDILTPPLTPTTPPGESKESNLFKLRIILKDPQLRFLFRDFLEHNFCEENLEFWTDYDSFRRRCSSPALLSPASQRQILEDAYLLWDSYLRQGSAFELNVECDLKEELTEEIARVFIQGQPVVSTYQNLLIILKLFDKVNDCVCTIMAIDAIPKFKKTFQYKKIISHPQMHSVSFELNDFPPPPSRRGTK